MIKNDIRFWIFNGNKINKDISIGKFNSKHKQNEVNLHNLRDQIEQEIKKYPLLKFSNINIPISKNHKREQYFLKIREQKCYFYDFKYLKGSNLRCDFKLNNKKFQEKICNNRNGKNSLHATSDNPYKKGQNDFYWFHFPDEQRFLFLTEQILIDNGFIKTDKQEGKNNFYFNITDIRYKNYVFNYDDPLLKNKLDTLIYNGVIPS
jgi:hypothetical protein